MLLSRPTLHTGLSRGNDEAIVYVRACVRAFEFVCRGRARVRVRVSADVWTLRTRDIVFIVHYAYQLQRGSTHWRFDML